MIEKASLNNRVCRKCGSFRGMDTCIRYVNVVTGDAAFAVEARRECQGKEWTPNAMSRIVDTMAGDTIETPKATIHRDPWDKITKTYE